MDNDKRLKFIGDSIIQLDKSLAIYHYKSLLSENENLIIDIKEIILGALICILNNNNYLLLLNNYNKASIIVSHGMIDITNFIMSIGIDDNDNYMELINNFDFDVKGLNKSIITGSLFWNRTSDSNIAINIKSDTLSKLDCSGKDNIIIDDLSDNIKEVQECNDLLYSLSEILSDILSIKDTINILSRKVFIYGGNNSENDE